MKKVFGMLAYIKNVNPWIWVIILAVVTVSLAAKNVTFAVDSVYARNGDAGIVATAKSLATARPHSDELVVLRDGERYDLVVTLSNESDADTVGYIAVAFVARDGTIHPLKIQYTLKSIAFYHEGWGMIQGWDTVFGAWNMASGEEGDYRLILSGENLPDAAGEVVVYWAEMPEYDNDD